jgi:endonuclease/exonuclease/phosphatase family metal-dependent hydrolase
MSYNIYGVKDVEPFIPSFEERQKNIERILNKELADHEIKVCCFQEVNRNNLKLLENILINNHFKILEKFPMKTQLDDQYNIIAIRNESSVVIQFVSCLPHGNDTEYQNIDHQIIDYGMSDYRTTVFVCFIYQNKKYLIGNIHTDYISTEGKVRGVVKTLNYMDSIEAEYKVVVGDMNMVSHMSEVYNILKQNDNFTVLSRSKNFNVSDNSWHGYGLKEQVNVDFAFIEKNIVNLCDYEIVKQKNIKEEGSDHRPIKTLVN